MITPDQVLGAYPRTIHLLLKITQSPLLTRYSDPILATVLPNRVGLGVEDGLVEIEGLGRGEDQISPCSTPGRLSSHRAV